MPEDRPVGRPDPEETYVPSLVDRLTAPESAGSGPSLGYRLPQVIEAVRRDLEDLLNTRQTHQGMSDAFPELLNSVAAYGLPDFSALDPTREKAQQQVVALLGAIVNRFEPRLRDVRAIPVEVAGDGRHGPTIKVHIDAKLRVEPFPDVTFESVIELTSGQTSVRRGDG
jgi:type VI secretion system protein ImpF